MLKHHRHTPAHLLLDKTAYFITGAIYKKRRLLAEETVKNQFTSLVKTSFKYFDWILEDWVILDNHYHLIGTSKIGADLPRLIQQIHGSSAQFIRKTSACTTPVWWNYWDYCLRDERDYRIHQNYLFNNPLKHGYVTDLRAYRYSSFPRFLESQGREPAVRQFRDYPEYRELVVKQDDF